MNQQKDIFVISPIIKCIFKNLSAKDLCSCAQVCRLWNSIADVERSYRKEVEWIFKIGLHEEFEIEKNQETADLCVDMEHDLKEDLKNIRTKPSFCMVFSTSHLYDRFEYVFPSFDEPQKKKMRSTNGKNRKYLDLFIQTALRPYLPTKCPITFAVTSGVIGCNRAMKSVEVEDGMALSCLLLQDYPGVEIKHIPITTKDFDINCHVGPDTHVKCMLMFLTQRAISCANQMVQSCFLKEESKVAIGGVICDRTESLLGSVVAFCGPKVEAASVIINSTDAKASIIDKLSVFKDTGLLAHRCVAFMFACVCRGHHLYRRYDVESAQFQQLYPNVPLVGQFGTGEIGVNYLPHLPVDHNVLQLGMFRKCIKKFFHSYTAVFVLVAFKE